MTQLVRYEAARAALAEAHRFDEVKDIRDKAEAMAAYARQANDTAMVEWATEIKVRAERRCGQMLKDSAEKGERAGIGQRRPHNNMSHDETSIARLSDIGITRGQSHRYQKLADMPEDHFETAVETAKAQTGQVTTAFMLRTAEGRSKGRVGRKPLKTKTAQAARQKLDELKDSEYVTTLIRQCIRVLETSVTHEHAEVIRQLADATSEALDRVSAPRQAA